MPEPDATATTAQTGTRRLRDGVEEPFPAVDRLQVHVRDLDVRERAPAHGERERPAGIVGMHVNLERGRVPDDEHRVAERVELALDLVGVEPLALDDEGCAIAVLRKLRVERLDRRRRLSGGRRPRQRRAGESSCDPAEDLDEPRGARIDDAGLGQDREHPARPDDAVVPARDHCGEIVSGLGRLRELANRSQHRPFDRLPNRAVGGVACRAERGSEPVSGRERIRGTADDLREDHPRVAARAHQRRA